MTADIENIIQLKWHAEERPLFDGVLFANGDIVLCECQALRAADASGTSIKVRALARSTLRSFLAYNPEESAWEAVTSTGTVDAGDVTVVFGEGSSGGDGFVALCDAGGERLRWMVFFQSSNPFRDAQVVNGEVVAVSTHDHRWIFPMDRPDLVCVVA